MSYPTVLLPQATYCPLAPEAVPTGWLLRWVTGQVAFTAQVSKVTGRPLLNISQLGSPAEQFPRGLSVNLLGQFAAAHAGWQPATPGAKAALGQLWPLGQPPIPPPPGEMQYLPSPDWSEYVLAVAELHGYLLQTPKGNFRVHVYHAPNCWNYWHYELRFWHEELAAWVNTPDLYPSPNQYRKTAEAIRQTFQEDGLAQPLVVTGTPAPWPPALFDTAASPAQP